MEYDIVMNVVRRHRRIAAISLRYLIKNTKAGKIFIITAAANFRCFKRLAAREPRIRLVDEGTVIPGADLPGVREYFFRKCGRPNRAGWYLQQFLKMGASALEELAEYYLVWDADTILLRPLDFFDDEGRMLIKPETEHHPPYFETYRRLLGRERAVDFSFISEHMMIKKAVMRELITAISLPDGEDNNWVWRILESIDPVQLGKSGFSEFETYGNFIATVYPDMIRCRRLDSWRRGAAKYGDHPNRFDLHRLSLQYAYVSFERRDRPNLLCVAAAKLSAFFFYWRYSGNL
jgi:hypothetical protein